MQPYEQLIQGLGALIGVDLQADMRQSCRIEFPNDDVVAQIDLDTRGDRILVGSNLFTLVPGSYREQIFMRALRVNALPRIPRGYLAFSEKSDALVLFQYLDLASTDPEKLYDFLKLFVDHARLWREALNKGDLPKLEEGHSGSSGMLGLR